MISNRASGSNFLTISISATSPFCEACPHSHKCGSSRGFNPLRSGGYAAEQAAF